MGMAAPGEVTELLVRWRDGDESALESLVPLVYGQLRRLAHRYMLAERPNHTLQTSALINETYLRLVDSDRVQWRDRAHFLAISAQLMRRVLVDFARSRSSQKRGGRGQMIALDSALIVDRGRSPDLVRIDDALNELARTAPRKAKMIEMRFFGGLSVTETAEALGVSVDTVLRDWRLARAQLLRLLTKGCHGD
jgi:RNA polymerase sigma factor (TIGR02999 family)